MTQARRPNFLLIMTDQQRWDHVGYQGHPLLRTPNIDRLAAQGSWLTNFFVASPTCMSNRASLMTGRMPALNGVRYNGVPLDYDFVTFVDLLAAAGYRSALIGKSHLQGMQATPSMVPRRAAEPGQVAPPEALSEARRSHPRMADYTVEVREKWLAEPGRAACVPPSYYGFQTVELCAGHGDDVTGHYEQWLRERDPSLAALRGAQHAVERGVSGHPQVYKPALPEELYPTRFVAERTVGWLERHAREAGRAPFFMQCSFPDPHHPFTPPGRYWNMYSSDEVELPRSFGDPARSAVPPMRLLWEEFEGGRSSKRWTFPFVADESQAREMIAKTFGQIAMIDDAIGEVVGALERLGLREDTVICFMSDHGDYLGDHGLMLKGPMHYQSLIKIPCVWSDPDPAYRRGGVDALASTLDLPRTILSRAGLAPFNGMQGHSLLPLLSGERRSVRSSVLVEQTTQYAYLGFDDVVLVHSLFDGRWRLSAWQGCPWGELYDLQDDPEERHNLWDAPAAAGQKSRLLLELIHALQSHADVSPYPLTVS